MQKEFFTFKERERRSCGWMPEKTREEDKAGVVARGQSF